MFLEGDENSDNGSVRSGGTSGVVTNITLRKLVTGMERTMYYM
jgi:hypothetical protein